MAKFLRQSFFHKSSKDTALVLDIDDAEPRPQNEYSDEDRSKEAAQDKIEEPEPEQVVASPKFDTPQRSPSKSSSREKKSSKADKKSDPKPSKPPRTKVSEKAKSRKLPDKGKTLEISRKKKDKSKGKQPELEIEPERPQSRKRRHRRNSSAEREFDSMEDQEGSLNDVDDFVGGYDFQDFEDEPGTRPDFSCLSPEEIIAAQKRQVSQIAELLQISASGASNLLRSYNWKTEKLLTKYFDNPDEVLEEAGLLAGNGHTGEAALEGTDECLVCTEEVDADESCALTCGHRICHGCWNSYLTMKITEGEVQRVSCPAVDCRLTVPDEVVKKLVDKPVYEKYLHFVTKSFVEDNTHVTWCPAPGCGNAITTDMISGQVVQCSCGFQFCFSCHHEAHAPASCEQVRTWNKKCNDDSETGHWMGANTKSCPRCSVYVEKNGGCNHMTCRQCTYEWCWMCSKVWKGHDDFYSCARYEKAEKKRAKQSSKSKKQSKLQMLEQEREQKRLALERYIKFYDKFLEYDNTVKNSQLKDRSHSLIQQLQTEQTTLTEVKFIEKATDTLLECYGAVKYSFVYAYFLDDDSTEKEIFSLHQENMIQTCSQLKALLESPGILQRRTEIVDLTKLAAKRKMNLVETESTGTL